MRKVLFILVFICLNGESAFADFCSSPKEMQSIYIASKAVALERVCQKLGYSMTSSEKAAIIMLSGDPTPMSEYKKMKGSCQEVCKLTNTSGNECNKHITHMFVELQISALSVDKNIDDLCNQLNDF